jgi:amidase
MAASDFDPLTTTAVGLQRLLDSKVLTSVQIVQRCLQQIDQYNGAGPCLNALLAVAPRHVLLSTAMALDEERAAGRLRSPLHGIPIIIKVAMCKLLSTYLQKTDIAQDNIMTHPNLGMPTTAGSWAFIEARPKKNAALAENLIQAGLIILGKANLTVCSSSSGINRVF